MNPNLNYISEISGDNIIFRNKLISIIKREFPIEKEEFLSNFNANHYVLAAQNVHKLKHKINLFGLKKGFETALKFENELNHKKVDSYKDFIVVLDLINNFLNRI